MPIMMQAYFENVVQSIEAKLGAGTGDDIARRHLTLEIARLGLRLFSGKDRVAWCGVLAPFDVLNAMGVTSCFVEFVGAALAAGGAAALPLQEAEQAGYSTDGCGYHRAVTGATLQGIMPDPDFLIATSAPCTGGLAVIENLARHFRKDLFAIHVPQDRSEAGVAYLADQFRAMTDFVAGHTGEALDPARLRAAMENVNRVREILLEVYAYARTVPSPARRRDMINFGILIPLLFGTDAAVRVAEAYRDEFARKVKAGVAGIRGEQLRLLWIQNRIQFRNPVDEWLEEQFRAAIVIDELNDIDWEPIDPDDPYVGLARRALSIPLTSTAATRVRNLQRLAKLYHVDGAVNPCHWGCRQGTGIRGLVEMGLKEVGVPVLNLEVDCVDERNFAAGQVRTRIEAFMEMLLTQRAAAATTALAG
jgi:benzoyl-CoA reductase/2-hydroxyglutaryl-CoA dehydratase subunit BcrC/BadD/HgdB